MATYKTAMGKSIDIDSLRVANENVIAVGNMKTNGRGDELGAGGKIAKTRAQLMQEYHKLNTPVASHDDIIESSTAVIQKPVTKLAQPLAEDIPVSASTPPEYTKPRGSLASAVASETEIVTTSGVKRI
jgi:hypothetical protein